MRDSGSGISGWLILPGKQWAVSDDLSLIRVGSSIGGVVSEHRLDATMAAHAASASPSGAFDVSN